ncbi:DUF4369 domain-containing protein [Flavobacterium jejuense]|uniref:DUF4369 domain-containing protein n=1 Tax=Flavobacterium jejuense TaxID=1544455 RepID=A0ABX0ITU9_9FLAO|nr:DUF4369 domain-containing protein [Flavobacterium jejuense]NHN26232.1 DUF4369 domain-containing protein [Flavobacterium jejuense]
MKKLLLFGVGLFTLIACNETETPEGILHLTGNVKGLSQGKLYIKKIEDTTLIVLDSIIIKGDSHFETTFPLKKPEVLYLFLDRGQTNSMDNNLSFFAEPGEMNIETNLKEFYAAAKITGSKNQDLLAEYNSFKSKFNDENLSLIEKRIKNTSNFNQQTADSIEEAYNRLLKRKYRYAANFATTHGEYEVAPYVALTEISDINLIYLDTIAKHMSRHVEASKYGRLLRKHIYDRKKAEFNSNDK